MIGYVIGVMLFIWVNVVLLCMLYYWVDVLYMLDDLGDLMLV